MLTRSARARTSSRCRRTRSRRARTSSSSTTSLPLVSRAQQVVLWSQCSLTSAGGSAKAAGELVAKLGGNTLEYLFIIELTFLQAASKLDAPMYSIVKVDD